MASTRASEDADGVTYVAKRKVEIDKLEMGSSDCRALVSFTPIADGPKLTY